MPVKPISTERGSEPRRTATTSGRTDGSIRPPRRRWTTVVVTVRRSADREVVEGLDGGRGGLERLLEQGRREQRDVLGLLERRVRGLDVDPDLPELLAGDG